MLAGHETVAKTVSKPDTLFHGRITFVTVLELIYALWELAKRPEIQRKLREEVTEAYEATRARGNEDFTPEDIDDMPFTNAVVKVCQPSNLNSKNIEF